MNPPLFERWRADALISDASFDRLRAAEKNRLFSLHWELRTLLYLGVLLISGGLGILIYKNIDTIGHTAIICFIAAISIAGFVYCFKKAVPWATSKVEAPNPYFDYVLLMACLAMVSFTGYLQYQYHVFGERYGLATFIPMLLLFAAAYYFDHLGILSMAITALCAWAGISVTPMRILQDNDFGNTSLIVTGIVTGLALLAAAALSRFRSLKAHFSFTYTNFGMHLLFISVLAALFVFEGLFLLWFLVLVGVTFYFYTQAEKQKSFYILLVLTIYFYIGLSFTVIRLLEIIGSNEGSIYLGFMYFIGSAIGLVLFLIRMNKKLKSA
jgi:hypothetical protein